jgi:hypothetical protein
MRDEAQALELLKAYYAEIEQHSSPWNLEPGDLATGRTILSANDQLRIAVVCAVLCHPPQPGYVFRASRDLLSQICRRSLPYTPNDIQEILLALSLTKQPYSIPAQALLRSLARPLADPAILAACRPSLEQLREAASQWYLSADQRKFLKLLDEILGGQQEHPVTIDPDDWGTQIVASLEEMQSGLREQWLALLQHCSAARGNTPHRKWLAQVPRLIEGLGKETFQRLAAAWIGAFSSNKGSPPDEENADLLKGLAWCCADVEDAPLASALADAAIEGYRKITGVGPRSAKVAGACVYALKNMPGLHGVAQLERVRLRVKQPTYLAGIESALDEAAGRAGMSRDTWKN